MSFLKYCFFYFVTFIKRQKKLLLLTILSVTVLVVLVFNLKAYFSKTLVKEGAVGTYTETDLPTLVTNLTSSSLITLDSTGSPSANLAESWQISEDGTLYTLKIKNNLVWNDNTPLKAQDINIRIPNVDMKAVDDQTLQFKLTDSFSPFLTLLNKPILKKDTLIGVGPYQITSLQKDQIFVRKVILTPKDKSKPEISIRFYPNERIAKNALKLGEIQALLGVTDPSDIQHQNNLALWSKTIYTQIVTIFYNTKDPILSDENFRLALSFAAPAISSEVEALTSIPPTSWAFNKNVKDYLNNPEQAKTALNRVKNGKDSTITLTATTFLKGVGEKVVETWNKQGIKAVLREESGVPQNFQALLIAQNIPPDPDQYSLWHSTQATTNISGYSSPRVDKDLEDGRKSSDQEVRKARYHDFQKILLDDAPATFLYFPKYNVVYMKKIEPQIKEILDLQINNI